MRRPIKILLASGLGLLAVLVLLLFLLSIVSWNFARPWLEQRISAATQRSFTIEGDLELRWETPESMYVGWRRALPWPHLRAHNVALANPDWAKTGPHMLRAPRVDFSLNPFALVRRTIAIPVLHLSAPELMLEIGPKGRNNWTFPKRDAQSGWKLLLDDLALDDGTIRLLNRERPADVTARVQTLDGGMQWSVRGDVDGEPVEGEGRAGNLLALRDEQVGYPFQGKVSIGKSVVTAEGVVTNPRRPSAIDVRLDIRGASMAQLFPFTGLALPKTPRFSTSGRLVGALGLGELHLRYEDFKGRMGRSEIGGTLEYQRGEPRPLLRGQVEAPHLDLDDLQALAGIGETKDERHVIPARPFGLERWAALDADVSLRAARIVRAGDLPIDALHAQVVLKDGVLKLDPLNFRLAGGTFRANLSVDGSREPAKGTLDVDARALRLEQVFPEVEGMPASVGAITMRAQLNGSGDSFAALAASAEGEVRAFVTEGSISKVALEAMGLNIGSVIVAKLFGDRQVPVHCLASDFAVSKGVMRTRVFVVDTPDALVGVEGKVDLGSEELALVIRQASKGPRFLALQSPLYVRGTFRNPRVGVDAGAVGVQAGAAAVLGAIAAPLAGLLALMDVGDEADSPCPQLLARVKEAPQAPRPAKGRGGAD